MKHFNINNNKTSTAIQRERHRSLDIYWLNTVSMDLYRITRVKKQH